MLLYKNAMNLVKFSDAMFNFSFGNILILSFCVALYKLYHLLNLITTSESKVIMLVIRWMQNTANMDYK